MLLPQTGPGLQAQTMFLLDVAGDTYTNYPSTAALFKTSGLQFLCNLSGYDQIRLNVLRGATSAATGSRLSVRGYTSTSLVVGNFAKLGTSSTDVVANVEGVNQITTSGWVDIDKGNLPASGDLYLAFVAHGGDDTADPKFISIAVELRSEQGDKVHIQADIGTSQQQARVWLNRDRHTVVDPTTATLTIYTTGGTYQGTYVSDSPDENGIFTFDLGLALSASTTYQLDAVVTDADGDVTGSYDVST